MKNTTLDHPATRREFLKTVAASLPATSVLSLTLANTARAATADQLPPIRAITRGPKFHWRGYYDKLLFDPTNRYVLANEADF